MISAKEAEELEEIKHLLRPLEAATRELCGEHYVTSSKVIPMVHCLLGKINETSAVLEIGKELKKSLLKQMEKRFGDIENVEILAVSTLLDPHFKRLHFKNPLACANAVNLLQCLYKE
ncbi:unnamed protein product [Acanthoscelides obtectus]|uniref:Uncharacterized protein n=1 Tax=Acanthoscelides obtectus TaxID=200917 RepID=A0A9P0K8I4_ACAOB|nr:unnamed protein product [Acanthoscelides obtectus]CAK1665859.1 Zinc finger BED domain-containing protein 4 [Acanthoscelides obtectus]